MKKKMKTKQSWIDKKKGSCGISRVAICVNVLQRTGIKNWGSWRITSAKEIFMTQPILLKWNDISFLLENYKTYL